jgi:K+-sensing histidine kinase KdpD
VVCARDLSPVRIVGLCNKADLELGPYLAADGRILDDIIKMFAAGARIGERHLRELQAIQAASAAALSLIELDELLPFISAQAARVFEADAASVMLWDRTRQNLVIRAHHNLTGRYVDELRIPRARAERAFQSAGSGPLLIQDLRVAGYAQPELVLAEGLVTSLSAPLMVGDTLNGVLNIYSKGSPRAFSSEQSELVMIYANQIAIAVENARLLEDARQHSQHWEALHASSKAISDGLSAERRPVLDKIVAEAVQRISAVSGPRPVSGILQFYYPETNELAFESVFPPELWTKLRRQLGDRRPLDRAAVSGGQIGITGRAVLVGESQRVDDVRLDPDYLLINPATASELAVPLLDNGDVLGVLSLESETPAAFDANDEIALRALAEFAVIAIKNSESADELSRANAVAMLGAWAADVVHDLNREIGAIRRSVYILQQQARLNKPLLERLEQIDQSVERLTSYAIPAEHLRAGVRPRSGQTASVDDVIRAEVSAYRAEYHLVKWESALICPNVSVSMNPQWLSRLLRHLIRNALDAMDGRPSPIMQLRTSHDRRMVYVEVEDNGKGVRPEIQNLLFLRSIPHEDSVRGRGQGLLLARFLAQQHGGNVELKWTRQDEGACFRLTVPIAAPD